MQNKFNPTLLGYKNYIYIYHRYLDITSSWIESISIVNKPHLIHLSWVYLFIYQKRKSHLYNFISENIFNPTYFGYKNRIYIYLTHMVMIWSNIWSISFVNKAYFLHLQRTWVSFVENEIAFSHLSSKIKSILIYIYL